MLPLLPVMLAVSQTLSTVAFVIRAVDSIQKGVPIMPENSQLKPEDVVANALMMGLNALFGAWESAYKATNGKIPAWAELSDQNKILQARIDAEKAKG